MRTLRPLQPYFVNALERECAVSPPPANIRLGMMLTRPPGEDQGRRVSSGRGPAPDLPFGRSAISAEQRPDLTRVRCRHLTVAVRVRLTPASRCRDAPSPGRDSARPSPR